MINENAISAIFNKAESKYLKNKDDSGIVLAAMMSSLYDHLSSLSSADGEFTYLNEGPTRLRGCHRSMFPAGDVINKLTPPLSGVIKLADIMNVANSQ